VSGPGHERLSGDARNSTMSARHGRSGIRDPGSEAGNPMEDRVDLLLRIDAALRGLRKMRHTQELQQPRGVCVPWVHVAEASTIPSDSAEVSSRGINEGHGMSMKNSADSTTTSATCCLVIRPITPFDVTGAAPLATKISDTLPRRIRVMISNNVASSLTVT